MILTLLILYMLVIYPFFNSRDRDFRWELMVAYWHVMASPFQKVDYRHYMLACVSSSLPRTFADMGVVFVYFNDGYWLTRDPVDQKKHEGFL